MPTPKRLADATIYDAAGNPIWLSRKFLPTNVVVTAAVASSAAVVLPAGSTSFLVTVAGPVGLIFGLVGVGAAALDNTTLLLLQPGTYLVDVPSTATHFRHIRAGAADAIVQIEAIPTQT